MAANAARLGYVDPPLSATYDDPSVGLATFGVAMAAGVVATITVDSTALFLQTHQFNLLVGLRDDTTKQYSNREKVRVYVTSGTTLAVVSRSDNTRTHAIGESLAAVPFAEDMEELRPTTTGSIPYLAASGNMAELLAGPDRTFVVYDSGLPIARAIQAADIPDLSASYATPGSVIGYVSGAYVPLTRTVNGHALSANVTVSASDVGLGSVENAAASGLYVPLTRSVNGHALSADVTVTKSDLSLGNVENTALSTWAGSTNLTTLGTIATGTWGGTAVAVNKGGTGQTAAGIAAFNAITGYSAAGATGTTSTNLVFSTSPTLVTPTLGAATATSINGNTFTTGTYTLTGTAGKTLAFSNTLTLTATDGSTLAIGGGGTLGTAAYTASSAYEVPLTFSSPLSRTTNTISLLVNVDHAFTVAQSITTAGIAATSTNALILKNTTASTSGTTVQYSGRILFAGHAWNTTATAADNYLEAIQELRPTSASTPTSTMAWGFRRSTDGSTGSFTDAMTLSSAGALALPASSTAAAPAILLHGDTGISSSAGNFSLSYAGGETVRVTGNSNFVLSSAMALQWNLAGVDLSISRAGAAILQLGSDVNGAAVSQTFQAANGITGTDKTGGNFTFASGKGTGAGAVSSLIFQTPTVLTTGTTAQSLATRLTISSASLLATVPIVQGANYHELTEMTAPSAGASDTVRIYAVDNGGGKTQLMALFASGAAQQLAIQP